MNNMLLSVVAKGSLRFFMFISLCVHAEEKCSLPGKLAQTFEKNHYRPRLLNDALSASIFNIFIQSLDPDAEIFSLDDINKLDELKFQIDDAIKSGDCSPYENIVQLYRENLIILLDHISTIQLSDLSIYHNIQFIIPDNHPRNKDVLKTLNIALKEAFLQKKLNEEKPLNNDASIFEQVKSVARCKYERLLSPDGGFEQDVFDKYLNAIALSYDPHSLYLNARNKELFTFNLDTDVLGYGFTVKLNMIGQLEIAEIVPGSLLWTTDKINKGDQVKAIYTNGAALDLKCMDTEEINNLLMQSPYESIVLEVRTNEKTIKMALKRQIIDQYNNTLKTFILNGEKHIAYISIPSFYTASEDRNNVKGLADDLAKQLVSLKTEQIEGIILDVRFNGGGSLEETVKLLGLFINEGPLFTLENSAHEVVNIKDPTRGMAYDGPLVVMVNELSASASEVFASTLQDWGRAVIVGSETFGKSTSQLTIPVYGTATNTHYANVTEEVLHRVNGSTYQGYGVMPDINLESIYKHLVLTEKDQFNYLKLSKLDPIDIQRQSIPLRQLRDSSELRMASFKSFEKIKNLNKEIGKGMIFNVRLEENYYKTDISSLELWIENLKKAGSSENDLFEIKIPEYAAFDVSLDKFLLKGYKDAMKQIENDIYLLESYNILTDYIELTNP